MEDSVETTKTVKTREDMIKEIVASCLVMANTISVDLKIPEEQKMQFAIRSIIDKTTKNNLTSDVPSDIIIKLFAGICSECRSLNNKIAPNANETEDKGIGGMFE